MSPYQINILLHYYTSPQAHPSEQTGNALWHDTIQAFMEEKLMEPNPLASPPDLDYEPSIYRMTHRGQFYVSDGLCKVPLPEREWRIPMSGMNSEQS